MAYKRYTQDFLISNPNSLIKNVKLGSEDKILSENLDESLDLDPNNYSIITPKFINLHIHLNYTRFKIKRQNLFPWIGDLMEEINKTNEVKTPNSWAYEEALIACQELQKTGTGFVIENSNYPLESFRAMKETNLQGIIGIEVFGSDPNNAQKIFEDKIRLIESLPNESGIQFTLSPHASYDVCPQLWALCQQWCNDHQRPLLSHLAESLEEESWFQNQKAPNAIRFWDSINTLKSKMDHWQSYSSSTEFLSKNKLLDSNSLLTHGVQLNEKDLEILSKHKVKLITCPRSNKFLNNGLPRYDLWKESEIQFGIGTDSRASNDNLDLRQEVNSIPSLSAKSRFELITFKAAQILDREVWSICGSNQGFLELKIPRNQLKLNENNLFDSIMDTEICKIINEIS